MRDRSSCALSVGEAAGGSTASISQISQLPDIKTVKKATSTSRWLKRMLLVRIVYSTVTLFARFLG